MVFIEFDTAALPQEQRFDWWREAVGRGVAPTRISSERASDFTASLGSLDMGALQLTTMAFPALSSERTAELVCRGDPETYELTLILDGAMEVSQGRNHAALRAGDFALWTSSRPYRGRAVSTPGSGAARAIILHLPRALVPVREARLGPLFARALSAGSGIGRILADHLVSVAREAPALDEPDSERLGLASLDLAAGLLAARAEAQDSILPETRHRVLLARIDVFIQDHLADPHLCPDAIAAHLHISVRLLHQLFHGRDETVSTAIRRRRLEHCYRDLTDPRLLTVPVHAIGARWGLTSPERFSRSFRAAYGVPPGEHRRMALGVRSETTLPALSANDG
ncbi:helix-turn-helix domain-containing protein [Streptomyces sp. AM 4-1-1]|uniref:AraC-like ligand-binding domain-containing protein n=1 Tax=Streptomyces sp. AM 4-1-1 TaxID=3028710 RepID=UPI0023BA3B64|nr:helix-turn-helix domain-containing protein [Streptomyces sp. AM 4-1-1]WEH37243.1 helix-turn-helix domain-containing protein [Streptomyces sp. AM 4-1-1]